MKFPAGFKNRAVLALSTVLIGAVAVTIFMQRPERPDWAFAFYLCGDSTAAAQQVENLYELADGASALAQNRYFVLLDRNAAAGADPATGFARGAAIFRPEKDRDHTLQHPVLPELPPSLSSTVFQSRILQGLTRAEQNLVCDY
jgi:hypothetical protein